MISLQNLLYAAVEALDHAVGLWSLRWGETALDTEVRTERAERVIARCGSFAKAKEPVRDAHPAAYEQTLKHTTLRPALVRAASLVSRSW